MSEPIGRVDFSRRILKRFPELRIIDGAIIYPTAGDRYCLEVLEPVGRNGEGVKWQRKRLFPTRVGWIPLENAEQRLQGYRNAYPDSDLCLCPVLRHKSQSGTQVLEQAEDGLTVSLVESFEWDKFKRRTGKRLSPHFQSADVLVGNPWLKTG